MFRDRDYDCYPFYLQRKYLLKRLDELADEFDLVLI